LSLLLRFRIRLIRLAAVFGLLAAHPAAAQQVNVDVRTVNISNELPGYLIDHLYARLGDVSFFILHLHRDRLVCRH